MKILIVYKKSAYESFSPKHRRSRDRAFRNLRRSHHIHYRTLGTVEAALRSRTLPFERRFRGQDFDEGRYHLVISVGGDGTFLDAAKRLVRTPILGVNSDPRNSVGRFCPADRICFEEILDDFLSRRLRPKPISRLSLRFSRVVRTYPVLNDILICHKVPAAMSRYRLSIRRTGEVQRSSGLWISTAAGSTGAMKSSKGKVLPIFSKQIQYLPRELFDGHGARYRLRGGVLSARRSGLFLTVESHMRDGRAYLDGAHVWAPFPYGERLEILQSDTPLNVLYSSGSGRSCGGG